MDRSIYLEAYGCALNLADYERLVNLLLDYGFTIVEDPSLADIVIIHTCTVKETTINRMYHRINLYAQQHKQVIISGCLAKTDANRLKDFICIPPGDIDQIISYLQPEEDKKQTHHHFRIHTGVGIIPISSGCLGTCTFCKVKLARGKLVSRPMDDILAELKETIRQGIQEIWLTSQDLGCYGYDRGTTLPELLTAIDSINGTFKVRLGMINPQYVIRFNDQLSSLLQSDRFYTFLHMPIQSGSDDVLKKMQRTYTCDSALDAITTLRSRLPALTLVTDVIAGFPGETMEDHQRTKKALERIQPDNINISRFSSLKGTAAHQFTDKVPVEEIARRSVDLTEQYHALALKRNRTWIGWKGTVRITEKGKKKTWIGRNFSYKQIILPSSTEVQQGQECVVEIVDCSPFDLKAVLLPKPNNSLR